MVEFAIVLPVLVVMLFGIIQFGIVFNNYVTLTDAVRAGARKAAVARQTADPAGAATTAVRSSAADLNQANLAVTVTSGWQPGSDVTVTATYPYSITSARLGRQRGQPHIQDDGEGRMTYRLRNIVIAVALGLLAAVLTIVYVTNYRKHVQHSQQQVGVLVAATDIPAGTSGAAIASGHMLKRETVPRTALVPGAISSPDQISRLVSTDAIMAGEQVSTRRFGDATELGVRAQLKGTMRAVQLSANPDSGARRDAARRRPRRPRREHERRQHERHPAALRPHLPAQPARPARTDARREDRQRLASATRSSRSCSR